MNGIPSHLGLLVPSLDVAIKNLAKYNFPKGVIQEWKSEGTREIYFGSEYNHSLLLIEAVNPGPYQRAMVKRGPGIHHFAIEVSDLKGFMASLVSKGSGWLLHPMSLQTIESQKTAYLARPGFPGLIEVLEKEKIKELPFFVEGVELPLDQENKKLLVDIGLSGLVKANGLLTSPESRAQNPSALTIYLGGEKILLQQLLSVD